MRRSPFYAYPNFPHSYYAPSPAEEPAYYHRQRRPFPRSSPAPTPPATPRSVINIPVFDSAPSCPASPLPPQQHPITAPSFSPPTSPAVSLIDPPSAATTIQSHFRGFRVRRHRPLLQLCSIAKARKQLEELQSELESPGFPLKVRASERERLRFSESVMAIILHLDAIEGSMVEVRSQRKEATKMAIRLQDAMDAIMMQRDEVDESKPTDGPFPHGAKALDEDPVPCHQSEEPLWPDVNLVQGEVRTGSEEGIMDVIPMQEEATSPEEDVAAKCMSNVENEDIVDEIVPPSLSIKEEDVGQQVEAGEHLTRTLGSLELVPQFEPAEVMNDAEQDISNVTGENAVGDAEEVNNGVNAVHFVAPNNHMLNNSIVGKMEQDASADNMNAANHGYAQETSFDRLHACMDVVQEVKGGLSQDVELSPGTPIAEEKCDYLHYSNAALQGPSTPLEKLTEGNCSLDGKGSPTLHRYEYENRCDVAHENPSGVANPCDEVKAQSSTMSMVETPLPPNNALLLQLSEDCRQLRSLVGKLVMQNKAQSKVLCALGERLDQLEHQQQLICQQQAREKRKLRKGSKRGIKCRNC